MNADVRLSLPDALLEELAERAKALVLEELGRRDAAVGPYLSIDEAARLLGYDVGTPDGRKRGRQRVYDLRSSGRLARLGDGDRVLVARAELEAWDHPRPMTTTSAGRAMA